MVHRTSITGVTGLTPVEALTFSFQLLKLENLQRWSFFIFIYIRSSRNSFIYTSHREKAYQEFFISDLLYSHQRGYPPRMASAPSQGKGISPLHDVSTQPGEGGIPLIWCQHPTRPTRRRGYPLCEPPTSLTTCATWWHHSDVKHFWLLFWSWFH